MNGNHVDVLIVGAGLSGVCAAHYLMSGCPGRSFTMIEARDRVGGTWDLFRYPGVRSDSDMYTLGYSFRPWRDPKAIADGASILSYVEETADELGITEHIQFGVRLESASWSSARKRWTVRARRVATGEEIELTAGFLWTCTGYYRYDEGYTPDFPGRERFGGQLVHPQHWPEDLDVSGKRVVIIGSGATAVTLAPELAAAGATVTMLQRSPTYIVSMPSEDAIAERLKARMSPERAHRLIRWKNILATMGMYQFSKRFPKRARAFILRGVRDALGESVPDLERHFTPLYDPWDQRVCLVPDGDLFRSLASGAVSLVTDHIETFTETGIALRSGNHLEADIVVSATGLQLQFLGGARLDLDGQPVDLAKTRMYKGAMLSDVPNAAFVLGYTNASWTLKCELACDWIARVLRHMDAHGYTVVRPRRTDPSVEEQPALDLSSGYVRRSLHELPTQGSKSPWRLHQNYVLDRHMYRRAPIADGVLEFAQD